MSDSENREVEKPEDLNGKADDASEGNTEKASGSKESASDSDSDNNSQPEQKNPPEAEAPAVVASEAKKEDVQEAARETSTAASEPRVTTRVDSQVVEKKPARSWGAIFNFILILCLAGALAYIVYEGQVRLEQQQVAGQNVGKNLQELERMQTQTFNNMAQAQQAEQKKLLKQLQDTQTLLNDSVQRITAQGKRLRAMSDTSRDDWLLAEAEYLLKLANQRIRIERSPEGAEALLEEADGILRDLDDPNMHPLRRAIAKDLTALKLLKKIDTEGIYLSLVALTDEIKNIPVVLTPRVEDQTLAAAQETADQKNKTFWQVVGGSWSRFTSSFDSYVRVVQHDKKPKPLLPIQDEMYLQQNLRLMLERAQLALLREQQDIFEQSLGQADKWLATYYNESDVLVKFRDELSVLSQNKVVQTLPDISHSLHLLHEYIGELHQLEGVKKPASSTAGKRVEKAL
ncbi:MAG: uroporphyrinogen-III C-methyltransferase [Agarilytica sp.]